MDCRTVLAEQIESLEGFLPDSELMELKAEGLLHLTFYSSTL